MRMTNSSYRDFKSNHIELDSKNPYGPTGKLVNIMVMNMTYGEEASTVSHFLDMNSDSNFLSGDSGMSRMSSSKYLSLYHSRDGTGFEPLHERAEKIAINHGIRSYYYPQFKEALDMLIEEYPDSFVMNEIITYEDVNDMYKLFGMEVQDGE